MKVVLLSLIKIYQATLSRDHGLWRGRYPYGFCPFYPSCSQYAYEAVEKHGVVKGGAKALQRIYRCRPGVEPAIDKV